MPIADSSCNRLPRRRFLQRVLGAAALGGVGGAWASMPPWNRLFTRSPTIVLITLDTTRADHLSCYGYARPTSPCIDRFAAEALIYENAISPATWTLPAHASLFTGKFVSSHGVALSCEGSLDLVVPSAESGPPAHWRARPLVENETTLAALLTQAGYSTSAVVACPWMKSVFGMSRGFERYDDDDIMTVNGRPAEKVTDRALQIMAAPSRRPKFLFLNYYDAHQPCQAPPEFQQQIDAHDAELEPPRTASAATLRWMHRQYDAEILYMDFHVGRLFDGLRKLGQFDDALIIVTADHGELIGEHNCFGHPGLVYQEAIQVPLIVKAPGPRRSTGRIADWVQLHDVFPLILQSADIEVPPGTQGNVPPDIRHPILVEGRTPHEFNAEVGGDWFALIEDGWKYAWSTGGEHQLFNLTDDPRELHNLFVHYPEHARTMADTLHEYLAELPQPGPQAAVPIGKGMQARLKSLGYLR